jgi:hypothetical protein
MKKDKNTSPVKWFIYILLGFELVLPQVDLRVFFISILGHDSFSRLHFSSVFLYEFWNWEFFAELANIRLLQSMQWYWSCWKKESQKLRMKGFLLMMLMERKIRMIEMMGLLSTKHLLRQNGNQNPKWDVYGVDGVEQVFEYRVVVSVFEQSATLNKKGKGRGRKRKRKIISK